VAKQTRQQKKTRFRDQKGPQDEFEHKLLDVARVARVTAGGRRFRFRAVVVVGDKKGRGGVGADKGKDVQFAIEKAVRDAKKNLFTVPMTKQGSLPHEAYGKSGSSMVFLKPGSEGRGIIAGGAVRAVCDMAGYKNVIGKIISRSGNKLNNARATIEALKKISPYGRCREGTKDTKVEKLQKEEVSNHADSSNPATKTEN
jgi:small subunit ribosomal protein S5